MPNAAGIQGDRYNLIPV